jgi:hypothetical protein
MHKRKENSDMLNAILRLTALSIIASKLFSRHATTPTELSEDEIDRLYGTPGEVLLEHMGTFDFPPGEVEKMMATIEDAFERVPE